MMTYLIPSLTFLLAVGGFLFGLYKWQKDLRAKRLIELCEEILAALYEVVDAFDYIRNPDLRGGETDARNKKPNETEEEAEIRGEAFVYYHRYDRKRECFLEFRKLKYRFMAVYGKCYENAFIEIQDTVNKVLYASAMRRELLISGSGNDSELLDLEEWMWLEFGEKDPVADKLEVPIQQIESKCRGEIKKQSSIFYRFWKDWA